MKAFCRALSPFPSGLSLVELMVALAIAVFLALGVTNLFLRSKISYLQDEEMARLQENGRYALRYLARELTMSGYLGGLLSQQLIRSAPSGTECFDYMLDTSLPVEHYNDVTAAGTGTRGHPRPPADCLVPGKHRPATDMLLVRRTMDAPHVLQGELMGTLNPDSTYLRREGYNARVSLESGGGAVTPSVDIWEYAPQMLFIRQYSIDADDGIPALCRMRLSPHGRRMAPVECLLEGIEDLQLQWGIDEDGDRRADRFASAPVTADLPRAVTARIYLLVRSIHPVSGHRDDKSYVLGEKVVAAAHDGFFRRVMQTSVLLRNASVNGPG